MDQYTGNQTSPPGQRSIHQKMNQSTGRRTQQQPFSHISTYHTSDQRPDCLGAVWISAQALGGHPSVSLLLEDLWCVSFCFMAFCWCHCYITEKVLFQILKTSSVWRWLDLLTRCLMRADNRWRSEGSRSWSCPAGALCPSFHLFILSFKLQFEDEKNWSIAYSTEIISKTFADDFSQN